MPARARLGESPVWSSLEQRLYWVDIEARALHRLDPTTGDDQAVQLTGRPTAVMLTAEPGLLLLAVEHQLVWARWGSPELKPWVALEAPGGAVRLNDGRCSPAGGVWVGSMHDPARDGVTAGRLHRVDADGRSEVIRDDVGVANGLAFSPDGRILYFADTPRRTVWAYPHDPATGRVSSPQVFFRFDDLPGRPDGACVDVDGGYWLACVYGGAVARIAPDGRLDRRIPLPVARPTRCTFGGSDLDVLFVTSMGDDPHGATSGEEDAGALLALRTGTQGVPEPVIAHSGWDLA